MRNEVKSRNGQPSEPLSWMSTLSVSIGSTEEAYRNFGF
jgi:hypothetical protein